jgi:hypothetical protein
MNNLLGEVLEKKRELFQTRGFRVSLPPQTPGSFSVNFDSAAHVGTLTYWSSGQCEVQFNSCKTGAVVLLETRRLETEMQLSSFIDEIFELLETKA